MFHSMKMKGRSASAITSMLAGSLVAAIGVSIPLVGCATTPESAENSGAPGAQGASETQPPPEGYATWEDYWKAKDKDYRDFDRDVRRHQMDRPVVPGLPR